MNFLFVLMTLLLPFFAHADLNSDFRQMEAQRKGPFGLNHLQATEGRVVVNRGNPPGKFLFQAAFRNDFAMSLAQKYDFYVGNLFTTNYYQLMGEFVYGDLNGSFPLDHEALIRKSRMAMPKAASMVRNWVLEKHYLQHFPGTPLHRSFQLRGISDTENEREYARYFFNFYLKGMTSDFEYLPATLLIKESPISASAAINKARELVATSYDYFKNLWGSDDPRVLRLYKLRNAIHNQLSEAVISEIDRYIQDFPFYKQEGHTYLFRVREILVEYYSVTPDKIARLAKTAGAHEIQSLLTQFNSQDSIQILRLANATANLRSQVEDVDSLLLITKTAQYLTKEISNFPELSPELLQAVIHTAYAEGFLIQKNWSYFLGKATMVRSQQEVQSLLNSIISVGLTTLQNSFKPNYSQWMGVESKMQYFTDSEIKSSALNLGAFL